MGLEERSKKKEWNVYQQCFGLMMCDVWILYDGRWIADRATMDGR